MNQFVLITGASRGIGKAIAIRYAQAGYNLYLTCKKNGDALHAFAEELERNCQISCKAFVCDMGNAEAVESLFKNISSIDIVINNAGIAWLGLLTDMTTQEWQEVMSVNLDALFYTSRYAIPLMLRQHSGRIINISSVWGSVGASAEVAYSASKGGVNAFTKALAKELAPSGIAVNAISCGVIDTDMNRAHLSAEEMDVLRNEIPADRIGTPQEVAALALLLADAPVYMTGQILTIDGGWI